jgi:hypothetical protein
MNSRRFLLGDGEQAKLIWHIKSGEEYFHHLFFAAMLIKRTHRCLYFLVIYKL